MKRTKRIHKNNNYFDCLLKKNITAILVGNVLDRMGRLYEWYPTYSEFWLKERHDNMFNTVVSHIIAIRNDRVYVMALLIKRFSRLETANLMSLISITNRGEKRGIRYYMGYDNLPRNMLSSVIELGNTGIEYALRRDLDSPINDFFEKESLFYEQINKEWEV